MKYSYSSHASPAPEAPPGGTLPAAGGTTAYTPALRPDALLGEIPLDPPGGPPLRQHLVTGWREELRGILRGEDHRLAVVVGPCSLHDPDAVLAYAKRLAEASVRLSGRLMVIMRAFAEKPRSVLGWKGLAGPDPLMDGSAGPSDGLRMTRQLLLDITDLGLPLACEMVSTTLPLYIGDVLTWSVIGARTVESQAHREVASGLPMPVGFKNSTCGDVQAAVNACRAAAVPHRFRADGPGGMLCDAETTGNPDCHIVLRGGQGGPNYSAGHVARAAGFLEAAGLQPRVMVDVSHGNSGKDAARQPQVAAAVAAQARGDRVVRGVLVESFLEGGRQEPGPPGSLVYGQSVTDACLPWQQTIPLLDDLASAAGARR